MDVDTDVAHYPNLGSGGMGVAVSNWKLARTVSKLGQIGITSGTALPVMLARRLQDGDPGGHMRHALDNFPFPNVAERILDKYFIDGGRKSGQPYKLTPMPCINNGRDFNELCVASNFSEVFLAKEGHDGIVGINYLEKIQFPHLASIYGAMLANVNAVFVGAGLATSVPDALEALVNHRPARYPIDVIGASAGTYSMTFDPSIFISEGGNVSNNLILPAFIPIVGSHVAAQYLFRATKSIVGESRIKINGLYVERDPSGGHNPNPRKPIGYTESRGEPIYIDIDQVNFDKMRELVGKWHIPFWLAGGYGDREGFLAAKKEGAKGIFAGTAFALSVDSGLDPESRRELVRAALEGRADVFNDPDASPAGFPFRVVSLENSLSDPKVFGRRKKVCDLGYLRHAYRKSDGTVGYRCPAEPVEDYLRKGGTIEETRGKKCICNGLAGSAGVPQLLPDGSYERPIFTLGRDYPKVVKFCKGGKSDYTAARVINVILGQES